MFFEIIEMHKNNYLEQNDVHLVKNEKKKKRKIVITLKKKMNVNYDGR